MIRLLVFFIFSISLQLGNAQVILEHLTKKDGLPSNYTSGIIQDNDGYIWIATPKGAVRYDGKKMKTYTVDDGLTSNEIVGFFKDGMGRIWFNCFGGKACYYYKGKIFKLKDSVLSQLIRESFSFFNLTDTIFVLTTLRQTKDCGFFYYYFVNTNKLEIFKTDSAFLCGHKSLGIDLFKRTNGRIDIRHMDIAIKSYYFFDRTSIGFTSFQDTIYVFDLKSGQLKHRYHLNSFNGLINISNKNGLILSTSEEVFLYKFNHRIQIKSALRGIFEDNQNNLWISSDNGVFKLSIVSVIEDTFLCFHSPIYSIKKIDEIIYLGSKNLGHLKLTNDSKLFISEESKIEGRVLDFLEINNVIYKATDRGLLTLSNRSSVPFFYERSNFSFKNISVKNDHESYFCIGPAGVLKTTYNKECIKSKLLYSKRAINVHYRKNGELVVSTIDGLLIWKDDNLPYQKVKLPFKNIEIINHINEDKSQNLILSSPIGLIINSNGNYYIIDKSKGILDNHINKTFTSADGKRLYVCTNKGLNIVDYSIKDKKLFYNIKSYTTSDGLPSEEVNCALEEGDKVYVGTMEGLFILSVKDTIKPFKIPIRLEGLLVNDSSLELKNKEWNHNQNTFQFNFSAFYHQRNKEMQFAYQLTPIDKNPIISDNPSIIYRGLAPGEYKLKVYAFDKHYPRLRKSQIWNYNFTISPPYYKTWWFISLITLLVVSGGFLIYINYIRRKQKQNLEVQTLLKQMAQHRLEALKGQMNPHFIFNSLNTVQHFIATHNEREAMDFIAKFSSLIRKMLDLARVDKLSLEKEIQFLKDYAEIEQIRYAHNFDVEFIIEMEDQDDIELPSMLVQPLLENAIKHGVSNLKERRGKIEVVVMTEVENWLNIKIKDNGNGLVKRDESSKVHTSAALDIIRERLTVYEVDGRKGNLDIQFSESGTVSELVVPI
jgi:signal transduction histidine kinase